MSLLDFITLIRKKPSSQKQLISTTWHDRNQILRGDHNLFVWERDLTSSVAKYASDITAVHPEPIRQHISTVDLPDQIAKARAQWFGVSQRPADAFWADVLKLTTDFIGFSKSRSGTLHIKVVTDNACTKFHTDGYQLRLFSTYHGLGTEWLPESAVNRSALGKTNESIVKDPSDIKRVGTGHVCILKGQLPDQGSEAKGIVHRSPGVTTPEQRRLILRIDI